VPVFQIYFVKTFFVIFVVAFASNLGLAEDWTTTDGVTYQSVKVVLVEDDDITILYKDGGARIPIFKLPPELQQRFDYSPAKAKIAAAARAKADAENAKEMQAEIDLANKMRQAQLVKDADARTQSK
jgi:hypothetical protein